VIIFDKRGTGLSDRTSSLPTFEERMDDVRAVMDAAGSEHAAVFGTSEGGAMSMLFAATYPERVQALVLCGTYAHFHSRGPHALKGLDEPVRLFAVESGRAP
jgi:pimeloyl-ACP methyl ester carboxylesterase